jgi:uncharacterized protein
MIMPEFIYLTHPFRDGFFEKPTAEENQILEEQFLYLKHAVEAGTVLLAGPCLDNTFGIIVVNCMDYKSAQAFMLNDPAIRGNVMMAELHPMQISLRGK